MGGKHNAGGCKCCCQVCNQFSDPWLLKFCGPSFVISDPDWTFVTSTTGNELYTDLQNMTAVTLPVSGAPTGTGTGHVLLWSSSAPTGIVTSFYPRSPGTLPAYYLLLPGNSWTYQRSSGFNWEFFGLMININVQSKCSDGTRRITYDVPFAGNLFGTMQANYTKITGPAGGGQLTMTKFESSYESVKDCTAILVGDPVSPIAPLTSMKMRLKWKPTTETLTC